MASREIIRFRMLNFCICYFLTLTLLTALPTDLLSLRQTRSVIHTEGTKTVPVIRHDSDSQDDRLQPSKSEELTSDPEEEVAEQDEDEEGLSVQNILKMARRMTKPNDYEKILMEAKMEEPPREVDERGLNETSSGGRAASSKKAIRWPYKMLIMIDSKYPPKEREKVEAGIFTLQSAMECFDFQIIPEARLPSFIDHVHIMWKSKDQGCHSVLGRKHGKQITAIQQECTARMGITMHELMHVLGFYHEHVRPDRDKYVDIHWDEIGDKWAEQYRIRDDQIVLNSEYDFESIMHYPENKFMSPHPGKVPNKVKMGQRDHLSPGDIKRLRALYPCDKHPKRAKGSKG